MKPTTEGSSAINFDMVCMSFGKENERGLKVVQGASKNSIFDEEMEIRAEISEIREDNTVKTANGNIINFEEKAFETVKENRQLVKEKGTIINFEERKTKRKSRMDKETR